MKRSRTAVTGFALKTHGRDGADRYRNVTAPVSAAALRDVDRADVSRPRMVIVERVAVDLPPLGEVGIAYMGASRVSE